jgi:hypothetical protein
VAPISSPAPVAEVAPVTAPTAAAGDAPVSGNVFGAVRLLLKETKTGGFAGKLDRVAAELARSPDDLLATVVAAGLKVPEKSREKPVFVEHAGEIFWLNKNAKDELWLNAKASKFADGEAESEKGGRRPRPRKKSE